jgi:hypothetical protein
VEAQALSQATDRTIERCDEMRQNIFSDVGDLLASIMRNRAFADSSVKYNPNGAIFTPPQHLEWRVLAGQSHLWLVLSAIGVTRPEAAQQTPRDQAVAFLRRCLHFEPADDGGGSERSPRPWS